MFWSWCLATEVKTAEFFTSSSTRFSGDVPGASSASTLFVVAPVLDAQAVAGSGGSKGALKRHLSEPGDDGEEPDVKKARQRVETLRALREYFVVAVGIVHVWTCSAGRRSFWIRTV